MIEFVLTGLCTGLLIFLILFILSFIALGTISFVIHLIALALRPLFAPKAPACLEPTA